ncbi:hypothetical protein [Thermodesulfovibrio yellowstonii]|uniref:hypothetical protein n=1 Tax=Thermodesulfovibrio yellowstonii TaxID=28262 RepID=UPI0004016E44|nr:hypothetical protein [Thermodesulfovibrio islandicus]
MKIRIQTGDTIWAYIEGEKSFCLVQAKECYKTAKTLWPDERTVILGLPSFEIDRIIKQANKELKINKKEDCDENQS